MQPKTIVPLDEEQDIYVVLDERGATLGTGTREVCEALVELTEIPLGLPSIFMRTEPLRSHATIRSAIII